VSKKNLIFVLRVKPASDLNQAVCARGFDIKDVERLARALEAFVVAPNARTTGFPWSFSAMTLTTPLNP